MDTRNIYKIIDANVNRLKEGLRVIEDVYRFYWTDVSFFRKIRQVRHNVSSIVEKTWNYNFLISSRNIREDDGRKRDILEMKRKDIREILYANFQRAKESLRVLEEFAKLKNTQQSYSFKKLRFILYELEKKAFEKK